MRYRLDQNPPLRHSDNGSIAVALDIKCGPQRDDGCVAYPDLEGSGWVLGDREKRFSSEELDGPHRGEDHLDSGIATERDGRAVSESDGAVLTDGRGENTGGGSLPEQGQQSEGDARQHRSNTQCHPRAPQRRSRLAPLLQWNRSIVAIALQLA